ncbi:uncharacterized protein PHACADRAFT_206560 [Phanerochaete carnosa HHB-10118-sp]|uniref:Uncharacterized protein n=1 Tax=Phanerochaete carnosa (strain HHB-10118-sp) TaxID=650164 RepID=K5WEF4_PHACS|nr:uncharacterized protein PHACADRAFT_206560 [Phanerochaete carnosa HHB-10118-sp]EKM57680.1 hypothetical protein PHACADRAFT_206560 [Phanerochaete carnosa HHB-10118-sp]
MTLIYNVVVEPPFGVDMHTKAFAVLCTDERYSYVPQPITYITRGSLILADMIVIILTWIKTFGDWKRARRNNVKVSSTTCLLRDGTLYFIVLLALNITQLLVYNSPTDLSSVGVLVSNVPLVLINRFMINLRTAGSEVLDHSMRITDQQQEQSTVQFRRSTNRLGNIGGTLQNGWDDDEPVEEENDTAELDGTQLS